jgi:DegV family protein with EDD domain
MSHRVAVVTDSTASLPPALVDQHGVVVVPLQVVIGTRSLDEGETTPDTVAAALRDRQSVSTSRPSPQLLLDAYQRAAKDGAESVVSVHLSAEVSGTYESAQLAAQDAPVPVETVDSRQVGMGTGFAVLAAVRARDAGADAPAAAAAARERGGRTTTLFYVDTMEYLRRGGRLGTAAALLGSALAVKPLLQVEGGRIVPLEKVRTSARALSRLEDLAVECAAEDGVDIAVHHLANLGRAETLAEHLRARLPALGALYVTEVSAVVGAHVGPGMLAVVVAPA